MKERTFGLAHNLQLLHTWLKLMTGLPYLCGDGVDELGAGIEK
jgi:hypothetical protein